MTSSQLVRWCWAGPPGERSGSGAIARFRDHLERRVAAPLFGIADAIATGDIERVDSAGVERAAAHDGHLGKVWSAMVELRIVMNVLSQLSDGVLPHHLADAAA
jgi:hypothetical protein